MDYVYTNYCILKTCGLEKKEFNEVMKGYTKPSLQISFEVDSLIGSIVIKNSGTNDINFQETFEYINNSFGEYIFADQDLKIEEALINYAIQNGYKFSVAESITGGLICSKLTSVPFCSKALFEGLVVYDPISKVRRLHVSSKTIDDKGLISSNTAEEMLDGLMTCKNIDYSISTTGCAGLECCEEIEPGVVYIGCASKKNNVKTIKKLVLDGNRNEVRNMAANYAIFMLLKQMQKDGGF